MMIQPINYYQTDTRWASKPYRTKAETATIGGSGCGPTCAAMVIQSIKNNGTTPITTCNWSVKNGYKATNQGTYWAYFVPQFKHYGISCKQTNNADSALKALKQGNWVIATMHKGNWTNGGHFILAYGYENNHVFINDPASTLKRRTCAKWSLFKDQSDAYWIVDVPEAIKNKGIKPYRSASVREYYISSTSGLKVRTGASTLNRVKRKAKYNEKVKVYATKGKWAMIDRGEWVNSDYLSKYIQEEGKVYKTLKNMNVRNGYTTKNTKIIKVLKQGTEFQITKIRGNWGYSPKYKGWICIKPEYCKNV